MKEFITAAFPWLMIGLALAVIAAAFAEEKRKGTEKRFGQRVIAGAGLGVIFGVVLNICGFWESEAFGLAIGPLWGMAVAALIKERDD
ncbi:MAG: hypothetical protein ACI4PQ_08605 [Butyricicoccaceae bacterium]